MQVMFGRLAMQGDIPRRLGERILNHCAGKTDTAIITGNGADRCHIGNTAFRCLTQPDFFEYLEHGVIDRSHSGSIKGAVAATFKTRADRTHFLRERCGAH